MIDSLFGTGKLERLHIVALLPVTNPDDTPKTSPKDEDKYEVQVNPDSYTFNHHVNYSHNNAIGSPGEDPKIDHVAPTTLDFTIFWDATGVVPVNPGPLDNVPIVGAVASLFGAKKEFKVMDEIKKFVAIVFDMNEPEHRPRRVRLTWGPQVYDGVLTSMSLNYKLFDSHGTPLRVEARVSFESALMDITRISEVKTASPDLTHKRTVLAGDTLPLMTHSIYGTTDYYIEVAKTNRLFNFRKLKAGGSVFFPPAKKTAT